MIRIDVRSANGEVLASVKAHPDFDPVLFGVERSRFPILGHLDPYGDTILNRLQVESLLNEIAELGPDGGVVPHGFVEDLVSISRECLVKPHRFLWFVGE